MVLSKEKRLYMNVILVYSTLIYVCKYKQLNYAKYISNNSTAMHIQSLTIKVQFFQKYKIEIRQKIREKGKNGK